MRAPNRHRERQEPEELPGLERWRPGREPGLERQEPGPERAGPAQESAGASVWSTPLGKAPLALGVAQALEEPVGSRAEPGQARHLSRPVQVPALFRQRQQAQASRLEAPVSASVSAPRQWAWVRVRVRVPALVPAHESNLHALPCDAGDQPAVPRCWRSDSSPRCREHHKDRGSPDWTSPFLLRAHRHGLLLARMTHPRGLAGRTGVSSRSTEEDQDARSDRAGTSRDDASGDCRAVLRRWRRTSARGNQRQPRSGPAPEKPGRKPGMRGRSPHIGQALLDTTTLLAHPPSRQWSKRHHVAGL